jgi:branched-chain amino acid transport system substrate-binding protein
MMKKSFTFGIFIMLMVLSSCGGPQASQTGPIKIGFAGDFSDVFSFYDLPMRDGAQLAIDEINAAGGVLNRKLELISKDGKNDQALTVQLTQELVDEGVVYMIGTTGFPNIAQGQLACKNNIPISTGDGTPPTHVVDIGECAFQLVMSDNVQGAVAAEYAYSLGYRTAYLLRSTEQPYTKNLPSYFQKAFENLGGKVLGEEQFRINAGDYSVVATNLANLDPKPDVIFTPMYIPDTPVFMRQLRGAGVEIPVLGADGNDDPSLLTAGASVEGLVFTTHASPAPGSKLAEFNAKYEKVTGNPPASVVVAIGYDEIYILKQVIESQKAADSAAIMKGLAELKGFKGITGTVDMTETRRAAKPVALVKVENGAFVFVNQFYPVYVPEP